METLNVQAVQLDLSVEVITAVREELTGGGLSTGTVLIGDVGSKREVLYLLWHQNGAVPVSMTLRNPLEDVARARHAAREFLLKWRQCSD